MDEEGRYVAKNTAYGIDNLLGEHLFLMKYEIRGISIHALSVNFDWMVY